MHSSPLDIYCIAIGGTGMAPLACLLKEQGHRVRGSDGPLYPPMSRLLEAAAITPLVGYDAAHLEASLSRPDLVIVGNAVPRHNPEVEAMERLGLTHLSMPQAVARFLLAGRRPLVVAGTHGKTTTTSMAAWVYSYCGADPGYLIGGLPLDMERSFRIGGGSRFIIEGDEYNAAYFDRGPKFLHYRPQTLILTSVEHDHVDLYPDPETLLAAYRQLVKGLPDDGLLVACGDTPEVRDVAREAPCRTLFYGLEAKNDIRPLARPDAGPRGTSWRVRDEAGEVTLDLAVSGEHNLLNALAVWTAARQDGLDAATVRDALVAFRGVERRLEERGRPRGIIVIDDFAHHPTAVAKSLGGLRARHQGGALIALFEPRSLTAGRSFFFEHYLEAFSQADVVLFAPVFHRDRLAANERLDLDELCQQLVAKGVEATPCASTDDVLARAVARARPGDVVVTMSSGSFDDLPRRLLAALA